jgi:hypothetical protein
MCTFYSLVIVEMRDYTLEDSRKKKYHPKVVELSSEKLHQSETLSVTNKLVYSTAKTNSTERG